MVIIPRLNLLWWQINADYSLHNQVNPGTPKPSRKPTVLLSRLSLLPLGRCGHVGTTASAILMVRIGMLASACATLGCLLVNGEASYRHTPPAATARIQATDLTADGIGSSAFWFLSTNWFMRPEMVSE